MCDIGTYADMICDPWHGANGEQLETDGHPYQRSLESYKVSLRLTFEEDFLKSDEMSAVVMKRIVEDHDNLPKIANTRRGFTRSSRIVSTM
ncbi:hypothetical protein PT974_03936 [Cladobotryum mycophilum]|uniref:Uncharacterized protein n=1 Tax=Cladobotryum mycophilum TaxID=491253 RepID=A0ABR0STQ2_9HYPO